jgi:hypothetical protein
MYNDFLQLYGIKDVKPISNGEKIKWCYLKDNNYNIETLALRDSNDPQQIIDFIKAFINYEYMFDKAFGKKINAIYNALKWGSLPKSNVSTKFFDFS